MSISDVLHGKGHTVVKVRAMETVQEAVRLLSHHGIGALIVEDQWMKPAGIFSERDFLNAVAHHGPQALASPVERFISAPIVTCRSSTCRWSTAARLERGGLPAPRGNRRAVTPARDHAILDRRRVP